MAKKKKNKNQQKKRNIRKNIDENKEIKNSLKIIDQNEDVKRRLFFNKIDAFGNILFSSCLKRSESGEVCGLRKTTINDDASYIYKVAEEICNMPEVTILTANDYDTVYADFVKTLQVKTPKDDFFTVFTDQYVEEKTHLLYLYVCGIKKNLKMTPTKFSNKEIENFFLNLYVKYVGIAKDVEVAEQVLDSYAIKFGVRAKRETYKNVVQILTLALTNKEVAQEVVDGINVDVDEYIRYLMSDGKTNNKIQLYSESYILHSTFIADYIFLLMEYLNIDFERPPHLLPESAPGKMQQTVAINESYSSDSQFYHSVLNAIERFAAATTEHLKALAFHSIGPNEYCDEYSTEWATKYFTGERYTKWNDRLYSELNDFPQTTPCFLFDPEDSAGCDADDDNEMNRKDEDTYNTYTLANLSKYRFFNEGMCPDIAIIAHLSIWLMQFLQLSGNVNIDDLFENNKLSQNEIKQLVNSQFIAYEKTNQKKEPTDYLGKMEFIGRILLCYTVKVLLKDREKTLIEFQNFSEKEGRGDNNAHIVTENETLKERNSELLYEIEDLKLNLSKDHQKNKEIKELKEENRALKHERTQLKKKIKSYKEELDEALIEKDILADVNEELEMNVKQSADSFGEDVYTEENFRKIIKNHRILLWGVRTDQHLVNLSAKYPEIEALPAATFIPTVKRMKRYDGIVCRVDQCSHGEYLATRKAITAAKVPCKYIKKGQSGDIYLWKAVIDMFGTED